MKICIVQLKQCLKSNLQAEMFLLEMKKVEIKKVTINGGMDKEDVVHIYNDISLSHNKEWKNAICSNIEGLRDDHTK